MNTINLNTIPRSKSEPILYSNLEPIINSNIKCIHNSNSDPNISISSKNKKVNELLNFIRNDMNKIIPNKKYLDSYKI